VTRLTHRESSPA